MNVYKHCSSWSLFAPRRKSIVLDCVGVVEYKQIVNKAQAIRIIEYDIPLLHPSACQMPKIHDCNNTKLGHRVSKFGAACAVGLKRVEYPGNGHSHAIGRRRAPLLCRGAFRAGEESSSPLYEVVYRRYEGPPGDFRPC